jgi:hypothetical protein
MARRLQFGVYCVATPSVAAALTRFRALTRGPFRHRSAQMTPAIYHKIVAIGATPRFHDYLASSGLRGFSW